MTVSLLWLKDYLQLPLTPEQISDALTSLGLEVEKMETRASIPGGLAGVVAGKVLTCEKHPDADRLSLTTVDVGIGDPRHIVCGANNVAAGQTVWVALPGTEIQLRDGKSFTINVSKIRGQLSEGMICAEDELGLGDSHDGIMVLPDDIAPGTPAADYYNVVTDTIYEIGLTPNRSDATSVIGVAEDLAAYLSVQQGIFYPVGYPAAPSLAMSKTGIDFAVEVRDTTRCPRYAGIILTGLTIGPSPAWMQQRLQAIGVKTINNVVDITNFVLHEMGQPLHAFDADSIAGQKIIVETKPSGTSFVALDGQTYSLHAEDLMICDGRGEPMCIAGVYGGLHSGVTEQTTSIFLESAHFQATSIRRTSMRHNLRTEAARRFEKGSDPEIPLRALERAVALLGEYAGGTPVSAVFDHYPHPVQPALVTLRLAHLREKTGVPFDRETVVSMLEALNMTFTLQGNDDWLVKVPTNKPDVTREADVIEEILRVYGFDRIGMPDRMSMRIAVEPKFTLHRMRRLIGQFLAARGCLEAMNLSLTQPAFYGQAGIGEPDEWVTIFNTSNESLNLLRPDLIVPMLDTLRRNINRRQENIRFYEFGKSYHKKDDLPSEREHLVIAMTGRPHDESWLTGDPGPVDYFALKGLVESLLRRIGIRTWETISVEPDAIWAYGVQVTAGGLDLGRFGMLNDRQVRGFDIRQAVFFADFHVEALVAIASRQAVTVADISKFPAVVRDLAVVVGEGTSFSDMLEVVKAAGGNWLARTEVFDIYRHPDHVGPGKKSIALRFTLENPGAVLSDKDIEDWFGRVQKAVIRDLGAEIRK